jgi:hypothetical protein
MADANSPRDVEPTAELMPSAATPISFIAAEYCP